MKFEFDPVKSKTNKSKHGLDFKEAQVLWEDVDVIEIRVKTTEEERYVVIGKIKDKHWTCVITYRKDKIRIISIRRSRESEVSIYEG